MMTHRERLETAWRFEEPDRVPVELDIPASVRAMPEAAYLVGLIDQEADNFRAVSSIDFGFLGLPTTYREREIHRDPDGSRRVERVHETPAGTFRAVTWHPAHAPSDYHWEERFIRSVSDLERVAAGPARPGAWDVQAHRERLLQLADGVFPMVALSHPLGNLVRSSTMEEVYMWLREVPDVVHRYLAAANEQVIAAVRSMQREFGEGLTFISWAHEMLIPPWMGRRMFEEFVFPYDSRVYAAVHEGGGRFRAHCHGNCMAFLERFAEMGIDAVEPLEPPPYADCNLAAAKRLVGDRMMLSGNVPSQAFPFMTPGQVRDLVREAIDVGAPGGGFSLRTTGGEGGLGTDMPRETFMRVLRNVEAYMEAGLEFGRR